MKVDMGFDSDDDEPVFVHGHRLNVGKKRLQQVHPWRPSLKLSSERRAQPYQRNARASR